MRYLFKLLPFVVASHIGFANTATMPINTCQDLQSMGQNLSGSYELNQDIDCTNFPWETITGVFTGSLDGQEHRIRNLTINSFPSGGYAGGIFTEMNHASVQNVYIDDPQLNINPMPATTAKSSSQNSSRIFQKYIKSPYDIIISGIISATAENCIFSKIAFKNAQIELDKANNAVLFGFIGGAERFSKVSQIYISESTINLGGNTRIQIKVGRQAFVFGFNTHNNKEIDHTLLVPTALQ